MARTKNGENPTIKVVNVRWTRNNLKRVLNSEISDGDYTIYKELAALADEIKNHFEEVCNQSRQERIAKLQAELDALNCLQSKRRC